MKKLLRLFVVPLGVLAWLVGWPLYVLGGAQLSVKKRRSKIRKRLAVSRLHHSDSLVPCPYACSGLNSPQAIVCHLCGRDLVAPALAQMRADAYNKRHDEGR